MTNNPISIYIHWPFCLSKCPYCDFNSHVASGIDHKLWLANYLRELDYFAGAIQGRFVQSVFFGGGTPSLMQPFVVAGIINKIADLGIITQETEISLEANPTSFEAAKFADFKHAGINRVSIGVQALRDYDLKNLGREHSSDSAKNAIIQASKIFERVSFDLIYARAGQSLKDWQIELKEAMLLAGGHISLYQLTIEKGTPFYKLFHTGQLILPENDLAADMYDWTCDYLKDAGYNRYEISNYAKPGHECRHNLAYWRYEEYLGIGPGAHSRLRENYGADSSSLHKRIPKLDAAIHGISNPYSEGNLGSDRKARGELAECTVVHEHKRIPKFDAAIHGISNPYSEGNLGSDRKARGELAECTVVHEHKRILKFDAAIHGISNPYSEGNLGSDRKARGELAECTVVHEHKRIPKLDAAIPKLPSLYAQVMHHAPSKWLNQVTNLGHGVQKLDKLNKNELVSEYLMMGLRLADGVDLKKIADFAQLEQATIISPKMLDTYYRAGLLSLKQDNLRLTDKGLMLHNYIVPRLLENIEN